MRRRRQTSGKRRPNAIRPPSTSAYTTVIADQPGRVVNLTGAVGQYAQAGTNLSMFVPDELWVTANFKETQLDRMRPGQPVDMEIDAYPERDFHGHLA